MIDWETVRREYITTGASYEKLSVKYGLPSSTIRARAGREGWKVQRAAHRQQIESKCNERAAELAVSEMETIAQARNLIIFALYKKAEEVASASGAETNSYELKALAEALRIIQDLLNRMEPASRVDDPLLKYLALMQADN